MPPQSHKRRRGHPRIHKHKTRRPDDPPSSASLQRRWAEAARRAQAAAEGTLSPDEAPVMVSSIYSFMPAHLNIPAGTPYTGIGSAEAHPGTFHGNLFSEYVVNLMLEQDYGSVEAGMEALKKMYANMDYLGVRTVVVFLRDTNLTSVLIRTNPLPAIPPSSALTSPASPSTCASGPA